MIIIDASCSCDDEILRSLLFLRMLKSDAGPVTQKMSEVTRWARDNAGYPHMATQLQNIKGINQSMIAVSAN